MRRDQIPVRKSRPLHLYRVNEWPGAQTELIWPRCRDAAKLARLETVRNEMLYNADKLEAELRRMREKLSHVQRITSAIHNRQGEI